MRYPISTPLTVNNTQFNYPVAGEPKGWGEDATAWATEVTAVLNDLKGPNDILQSSFTITNNQVSFIDIVGLLFDPASVRRATINYNISRSTDSSTIVESGNLEITYNPDLGQWYLSRDDDGNVPNVEFDVTNSGQVQYTSSNLSGLNYEGTITFRAKTLDII